MLRNAQSETPVAEFRRELGNRIRLVRKQKNMTLAQLAQHLPISMQQLSKIEKASVNANIDTIVHIAHGLGISPIELMPGYEQISGRSSADDWDTDRQRDVWDRIKNLDLRTSMRSLYEAAKDHNP